MFCTVYCGLIPTVAQQERTTQSLRNYPTFPHIKAINERHIESSLNGFVKELDSLFKHGAYGEVIEKASSQIDAMKEPDTRLVYLRGAAAWRVGLFALANQDMSRIGAFRLHSTWPSATTYTIKLQRIKALLPPRVREVRSDENVVFRVFYSNNDNWTSGIIKLLPLAYRLNRRIIKQPVTETQVFIFKNYEDFKAFYRLKSDGRSPGSWTWAAGDAGVMFFSRGVPGASPKASDVNSDYFQTTVVHEFNHTLVNAISGSAHMPVWLKEGLATLVGTQASRENATSIKQRMQRAASVNAFLPLTGLSSRQEFAKNTEDYVTKSRKNIYCADTYPQSCFMASYFLSLLPTQGLEAFLTDLGQKRNFDEVFQKYTQHTPDAFYRDWLAQITKQFHQPSLS
ncbi:hypothetical protein IAD21_00699 [Abditibacteriota bacterium]|nr:hypothetical protein IAD21_00699 [Abditibacteriota bacterium]